jgi:hypothetical protein
MQRVQRTIGNNISVQPIDRSLWDMRPGCKPININPRAGNTAGLD